MTGLPLSLLWVGPGELLARPGVSVLRAGDLDAATARAHDAVLIAAPDAAALAAWAARPELALAAFDSAVLLLTPVADEALELELLRQGVQEIVSVADAEVLWRATCHAVARKRAERALRHAYATDLATGLPHQDQLVEHMTQLLALRERQPAPMVLIVMRIDGYAQVAARLGVESAHVLRRKVAVRLRSLLRAGDVVAAIAPDAFGVLLGHIDDKSDGQRVAAKLVRALQQPVSVAGQTCIVEASVGLALYPDHGKDAGSLLKRASAQAGSVASLGAEGFAGQSQRSGGPAANDEGS